MNDAAPAPSASTPSASTPSASTPSVSTPAAAMTSPAMAQRLLRTLWFMLAWVALGQVGGLDLLVGLGASVIAAELSLRLIPPAGRRRSPRALGLFALNFIHRSAVAGVDLARRVFNPALPLAPGVLAVECGLPPGLTRQAFAAVSSLQPGTLPVGEDEEALLLHVLDLDGPVLDELDADLAVFLDAVGADAASLEAGASPPAPTGEEQRA